MAGEPHLLSFTVGSRRIASVSRNLTSFAFSLDDALRRRLPPLPDEGCDGLRVLSVPLEMEAQLRARFPRHLAGGRSSYRRFYIAMGGSYEDYLAQFSGKTRSTLRRKRRRLEDASGGALDLRVYRQPEELDEFLRHALPLSRKTYQSRMLDAGLPEDEATHAEMRELLRQDRLRAFLLFLGGEPLAYLCLPIKEGVLIYAHLGYDPAQAHLSPGTVLQLAALECLFGEERFRYFDFTEGEGAHKRMFGTDYVECSSFLLLKPTWTNRLLLLSLWSFESIMALAKGLSTRLGLARRLRRMLR